MQNDNVYINDGEPYVAHAPKEQQRSQSQKRNDTLAQLPLLKEMLQHIEDRIAATDSVKQALIVAETYGCTKDDALVALDLVRQQLETERGFLIGRIDSV